MKEDCEANLYKNFGSKQSKNATFLTIELYIYMIKNRSKININNNTKEVLQTSFCNI